MEASGEEGSEWKMEEIEGDQLGGGGGGGGGGGEGGRGGGWGGGAVWVGEYSHVVVGR